MDSGYPVVPIANFLGCVLALVPLLGMPLRPQMIGSFMFGIWVSWLSLSVGVNSVVWSNNYNDLAPVWCDISSHLNIASNVAIPACSLVITRRLYGITSLRSATISPKQKRIEFYIDLFLCIGLPLLVTGLYYIVQGVRYQVLEEIGCASGEDFCGVSMILTDSWGILFPAISLFFYSPFIVRFIIKNRHDMSAVLSKYDMIARGDFYRLLILGCFDVALTLPIGISSLNAAIRGLGPNLTFWYGWAPIHDNWAPVFLPAEEWKSTGSWGVFNLRWGQWINPFFAVVFFVIFGVNRATMQVYRRFFWKIAKPLGLAPKPRLVEKTSDIVFQASRSTALSVTDQPDEAETGYDFDPGYQATTSGTSFNKEKV